MVRLELKRNKTNNVATLGYITMYENDKVIGGWYTLEPTNKIVHGCLPVGEYVVQLSKTPTWSRFYGKRNYEYQIRVYDPKNRGILIHIGNTATDTQGCILVGCATTTYSILQSTIAYKQIVGTFIEKGLLDKFINLKIK